MVQNLKYISSKYTWHHYKQKRNTNNLLKIFFKETYTAYKTIMMSLENGRKKLIGEYVLWTLLTTVQSLAKYFKAQSILDMYSKRPYLLGKYNFLNMCLCLCVTFSSQNRGLYNIMLHIKQSKNYQKCNKLI